MDKKDRKKIKEGIIWNIVNDRGGGDPASIVISDYSPNPTLNGKNLAEVTMINGLKPTPSNAAEVLMDMVYVSNGRGDISLFKRTGYRTDHETSACNACFRWWYS